MDFIVIITWSMPKGISDLVKIGERKKMKILILTRFHIPPAGLQGGLVLEKGRGGKHP